MLQPWPASTTMRAPRAPAPRPGTAGSSAGTSGPAPRSSRLFGRRRRRSSVRSSSSPPRRDRASSSDMNATLTASPACSRRGQLVAQLQDLAPGTSVARDLAASSTSRPTSRRRPGRTLQLQQILGAPQRILQRAVGLVELRRVRASDACARPRIGLGEAVGVELPRELLVRALDRPRSTSNRAAGRAARNDRSRVRWQDPCTPRRTGAAPPSDRTNRLRRRLSPTRRRVRRLQARTEALAAAAGALDVGVFELEAAADHQRRVVELVPSR